jgi:hypothetical protein
MDRGPERRHWAKFNVGSPFAAGTRSEADGTTDGGRAGEVIPRNFLPRLLLQVRQGPTFGVC